MDSEMLTHEATGEHPVIHQKSRDDVLESALARLDAGTVLAKRAVRTVVLGDRHQ